MIERTYTPERQLSDPVALMRRMASDLAASRELAWRLFIRNLQAQYRQTVLGYLWAFLPVVITTLTFVFLNSAGVVAVGDLPIPYPAYVLIGTVLWQLFFDALNSPIRLVTQSRSLLARIDFPREALILAGLGEVVVNFLIRAALTLPVMLYYGIGIHGTMALFPIAAVALAVLGLMLGMLLTPIAILYQDVEKALPLIGGFWMLLTPIVYPAPHRYPASLLAELNPVNPLVQTARDWLTGQAVAAQPGFVPVAATSVVLLAVGWVMYRLAMPHLIARMGS